MWVFHSPSPNQRSSAEEITERLRLGCLGPAGMRGITARLSAGGIRRSRARGSPQQLRQLGDVRRDAAGLITGEQLGGRKTLPIKESPDRQATGAGLAKPPFGAAMRLGWRGQWLRSRQKPKGRQPLCWAIRSICRKCKSDKLRGKLTLSNIAPRSHRAHDRVTARHSWRGARSCGATKNRRSS